MVERAQAVEELRATAAALRLGMDAQGNASYLRFIDALSAHLNAEPVRAPEIAPWLPEILEAHGRGDYLRMADLLEFELQPRLLAAP